MQNLIFTLNNQVYWVTNFYWSEGALFETGFFVDKRYQPRCSFQIHDWSSDEHQIHLVKSEPDLKAINHNFLFYI